MVRTLFCSGIAFVAAVFAACSFLDVNVKKTSLTVSLPASRALLLDGDSLPSGVFEIIVKGADSANSAIEISKTGDAGTAVVFEDLAAGTYDVSGKYIVEGECYGSGKTKAVVAADQDTVVELTIFTNRVKRITDVTFSGYTGQTSFENITDIDAYIETDDFKNSIKVNFDLNNGHKEENSSSLIETQWDATDGGDSTCRFVKVLYDGAAIGGVFLKVGTPNASLVSAVEKIVQSKGRQAVVVSGAIDRYDFKALIAALNVNNGIKVNLDMSGVTGITTLTNEFQNCTSLASISLPGGITALGDNAFNGCSSLESIAIPDTVAAISQHAFKDCISLKNVILPAGLVAIYPETFMGCSSLESITIPASVINIGLNAFYGCEKLASVVFADSTKLWKINTSSDEVWNSIVDVSDAGANASNLTGNYIDKIWFRTDTVKGSAGENANIKISTTIYDKTDFVDVEATSVLPAYKVCKFEVTQQLYQAVMEDNPSAGSSGADSGETQELRPVEKVNWYTAIAFCNEFTKKTLGQDNCVYYSDAAYTSVYTKDNASSQADVYQKLTKKGYRLPLEKEWDNAADDGHKYSGSDNPIDVAWYTGNSGEPNKTHQVGLKTPNVLGIYDMSGNVAEWCWDWYSASGSSIVTGPESGSNKSRKGGAFSSAANFIELGYRKGDTPNSEFDLIGLRLFRTK